MRKIVKSMRINFEIIRVYAGWFDVKFITEEKQVEISASDAWENDSPKYFLKMLIDLLNNESNVGYVVFDEEPGTYIVCLEQDKECKLSILYSNFDDDEWKIELCGERTRAQLEKIIPDTEELFVANGFSLQHFVRTVYRSFEEYMTGERLIEYEVNWMNFPKDELEELRGILKE